MTARRWIPYGMLTAFFFGVAGFVAFELGLHLSAYVRLGSHEGPLGAAFVAGPAFLFGGVTALVAGYGLAGAPEARTRAVWAAAGYLFLIGALLSALSKPDRTPTAAPSS